MSEGKRPGGLTAMAVLNFIFSGLNILSLLGMAVMFTFLKMIPTDEMDANTRTQIEAMQDMGLPMLLFILALTAAAAVLLLLSGIGYIKQKKVMGRTLGNIYAMLAIISGVVTGFLFDPELGGGFNIGAMVGLIYPILTLFLLNMTFKDDLAN